MKLSIVALALPILISTLTEAAARHVYCYATVQRSGGKLSRFLGLECTIYLTPVFDSEDSEYLLAAEFSQAIPEAGQATCVTDEVEADLPHAWTDFRDGAKADNCGVEMRSPPTDSEVQPSE